eukprot:Nitzschia sp. Nitz4//scaffold31_size150131//117489//120534//NITZ4_002847-RA/size150131-augustus-gene-0.8-mRNA-1//1//CDS//3329547716//9255//frame0
MTEPVVEIVEPPASTPEQPTAVDVDKKPKPSKDIVTSKLKSAESGEHRLNSTARGESTIEMLAKKIEERRATRIPVTLEIRKIFLHRCVEISQKEATRNKISKKALYALRQEYKDACDGVDPASHSNFGRVFGVWNKDAVMLELLNRACERVEAIHSDCLFFRDFLFYNTAAAHRIRLFGNPVLGSLTSIFLFYLCSAILFCPIMKDVHVCPNRDSYEGWLTAVYFASVTMSTVGYGDVSLASEDGWRVFIGIVFMLVAMGVAYTVFSTAAGAALDASHIGNVAESIIGPYLSKMDDSTPLYVQIRRVVAFRISELVFWFFALNLIGMFLVRIFIRNTDVESQDWSWMDTFYWAVQTTTTIGYGDLDMPFDMRWFQIFYTTFGTAFMGAVFGAAASLKSDITDLSRFYAWKRREVSKRMIEDFQGPDGDDRVDQYEFLVGSLLMLNKLSSSDIEQIMDKFRDLAGNKGYIIADDADHGSAIEDEEDREDSGEIVEMEKPQCKEKIGCSIRLKGTAPFYRRLRELFFAPTRSKTWKSIGGNRLQVRRVHTSPHIYEISNFLSEAELQYFERFIETCPFRKSFVDNMQYGEDGEAETTTSSKSQDSSDENKPKRQRRTMVDATHRTSTFFGFKHRADTTIRAIEQRAADLLGCWVHQLEGLQLVRYLPGQFFGIHHDMGDLLDNDEVVLPPKNLAVKRRLVTLFVYLNDLSKDQGGGTYFPKCDDLRVRPRKGMAVMWSNINGEGGPDNDTIHAGEVVNPKCEKGVAKYGLNIWVTEE